ncbi:MAG: thioredoxin [Phycisphaerae bacterium]|nr:thioredoxin [Phycisphaerae bacterium]
MSSQNVLELTDSNFEDEILKVGQPALVDFGAEWCMPCKMLAPTVEEIASDYNGRIKVGQVDTDSNRDISLRFGISAIPTVILFKDGEMVKKFVGLQQKANLKAAIDEILD